jgi:hypothetical protein
MFQNVVWGFMWRRVQEVGGWVGTIAGVAALIWQGLKPAQQEVLGRLISAGWENVTLGDIKLVLPGLFLAAAGYWQSWRATRQPQAVTRDGTKVALDKLPPTTRAKIEIDVKKVPAKPAPRLPSGGIGGLLKGIFTR